MVVIDLESPPARRLRRSAPETRPFTNNGTVSGANAPEAPVTVRSGQVGANFVRSNQASRVS